MADLNWRVAWKWEQQVRLAYERRLLALGVDPADLRADQHDAHAFAIATRATANERNGS